MKINYFKVYIEWISGQGNSLSPYFEGNFYVSKKEEICKSISKILCTICNTIPESVYVECDKEDLKIKLIAEIIREHPDFSIDTKKKITGEAWGYNIIIKEREKELK